MDTTAASPVGIEIQDRRPGFFSHVGQGFFYGTAISSAAYTVMGYRSAPAGRKLIRAAHGALVKGPRFGGFFGAYNGLSYALESVMIHVRHEDDTWNSASAGAAAFYVLHLPVLGHRGAVVSAVVGAVCGTLSGLTRSLDDDK